jgi:DUF917 family protein
MTLLDHDALDEIALGATVLGTGGGGDPIWEVPASRGSGKLSHCSC